jgi:predicted outer membrane protein
MKMMSIPNERWQSQQKVAWAKLARSEAPDQQVEDFAEQMITEHSPVQRALRDLAAKLAVTAADRGTANAVNAEVEHRDADAARAKR